MTATAGDRRVISYVPNTYGGVLRYDGVVADATYWDRIWDRLDHYTDYERAERGHLPRQLAATFLRWVKPGARVLEAGCGLATFTVATRARGFETDGVDYASKVVQRLQERFPDIAFFEGDVTNLVGVGDGTYDAVYSPGVCEHFEEGPEAVLRESHRILTPAGILVVSIPSFNAFRKTVYRFGAFQRPKSQPFYQYAFSKEEMTAVLERVGFEVVQTRHYGTLKTLSDHVPLVARAPLGPLRNPLAVTLDSLPAVRDWGHSCIWVGRKL